MNNQRELNTKLVRIYRSPNEAEVRLRVSSKELCSLPELTGISEHVAEARVGADDREEVHPERHGVQLASLVELVQENLRW